MSSSEQSSDLQTVNQSNIQSNNIENSDSGAGVSISEVSSLGFNMPQSSGSTSGGLLPGNHESYDLLPSDSADVASLSSLATVHYSDGSSGLPSTSDSLASWLQSVNCGFAFDMLVASGLDSLAMIKTLTPADLPVLETQLESLPVFKRRLVLREVNKVVTALIEPSTSQSSAAPPYSTQGSEVHGRGKVPTS